MYDYVCIYIYIYTYSASSINPWIINRFLHQATTSTVSPLLLEGHAWNGADDECHDAADEPTRHEGGLAENTHRAHHAHI